MVSGTWATNPRAPTTTPSPTLLSDIASEWTATLALAGGGFSLARQTVPSCPTTVKRAATPWHLLDRSTPWLAWWQELILNWVSSWDTVGCLTVTSAADPEEFAAWDLPSDLELQRLELEELLTVGEGEG